MTRTRRRGGSDPAGTLSTAADYLHAARTDGERHLAEFALSVARRERIPSETIQYLSEAFREFLSGKKIAEALALSTRRGRRAIQPSVINTVGREVWRQRYYGATYEEAIMVVCAQFGLTRNTVTEYYARAKREDGVPKGKQARSEHPIYPSNPIKRREYLGGLVKAAAARLGASPKGMRNAHSKGRNSVPSARKPGR